MKMLPGGGSRGEAGPPHPSIRLPPAGRSVANSFHSCTRQLFHLEWSTDPTTALSLHRSLGAIARDWFAHRDLASAAPALGSARPFPPTVRRAFVLDPRCGAPCRLLSSSS